MSAISPVPPSRHESELPMKLRLEPPAARAATLRAVVALTSLAVLASCAVGPNYKRPSADAPAQYKESPADTARSPNAAGASSAQAANADEANTVSPSWWTLFNDPLLNDLESRVAVSNQNLAASEAAYRQATSVVREQRASFFPFISVGAGATQAGGPGRSGATVTTGGSNVSKTTTGRSSESYQAGANASWEIDLWGRLRRSLENAHALADASADDLAGAKLSLQAQLATAYLQLREADAEVRLLTDTVTAYARSLLIAQNRYNVGAAAKTDVLQAQTQLANAQEQSAAQVLQRVQLEHAIAALVGTAAGNFTLEADPSWKTSVPDVPAGVPSTLLQRRPDIAAAERRVAAANASIGIQEAAYFPSLTLSGSYEFLSSSVGSLFDTANQVHTLGASVAQTLFDAGATRARVSGARAAYDQSVAEYRQSVLTAFQDVEDQLAATRQLQIQYEFRRQASEAADESERLTFNQYRAGTVGYTNVVIAQTAALSARVALAQIVAQRQATTIALIQALGGGWSTL
jgi:NodT family efflux transporter outer membrane factor (OMF) lipoprotein